jgi:hypothetical protein
MHWHQVISLFLFTISTLNLTYVAIVTYRSIGSGEIYSVFDHVAHPCSPLNLTSFSSGYRGHDFPETLPLPILGELPVVSMVTEETVQYPTIGRFSDPEWFSLTSTDFGYVRLGPDGRLFIVSMFHQFHCLRVLNLAFSKARIATPGHLQHCLNYLRQAALCSADLTLEPGNFEDKDYRVEKTGATYTCRDWSIAYSTMEEYSIQWNHRNHTCVTFDPAVVQPCY